jgi:hypothetical protein
MCCCGSECVEDPARLGGVRRDDGDAEAAEVEDVHSGIPNGTRLAMLSFPSP